MALLSTDRFWDRVRSGSPMISDGAMGSELIGQGICAEHVLRTNILDERIVRSIHDAYIAAGAQFITSNTFGIRGGSDWYSDCLAGANIALNAAIAASDEISVWLSFPPKVVADETNALCGLFDSASIRPLMLLIETCTTLELAREAIRSARLIGPEVLAVTAHFGANGTLPDGATPEEWIKALDGEGVHIMGANCGDSPETFVGITSRMRNTTASPLLVQPSAGLPTKDRTGGWRYSVEPVRFAQAAVKLRDAGATIVGGCCGVTPTHIAAARSRLLQPQG